jgi:electron transport complex protein RnfB
VIPNLARQIEDLLPQTQCTKCGFAGCAPYAQAIADGTASYNQCPPGGQQGIERLAKLLSQPIIALNPEHGEERPRPRAVIDESVCIGCTLCIQACPVDAIAGAAKLMHTVIDDDCTGCDLCVAPCPVDCIAMVPVTGTSTGWDAWTQRQADAARKHYQRRLARQDGERVAAEERATERVSLANAEAARLAASQGDAAADETGSKQGSEEDSEQARKRAIIQAAIERARARRLAAEAPATTDIKK